jgi:hypothetical protein
MSYRLLRHSKSFDTIKNLRSAHRALSFVHFLNFKDIFPGPKISRVNGGNRVGGRGVYGRVDCSFYWLIAVVFTKFILY